MNRFDVKSLDIPELELYRSLREKTYHWRRGVFVAESERVVTKLIDSGWGVVSMLMSPEWYYMLGSKLKAERFEDVDIYVADESILETIIGYKLHKNLMAIGNIPASPAFEDLGWRDGATNVHVAVQGIADAENMGMIIRNCVGFGVDTLIVGSESSSPYLRRSVRVSVGSIFSLRILMVDDVVAALQKLRAMHSWKLVATTPERGIATLPQSIPNAPLCLMFGSEAYGLTPKAIAMSDERFTIPMHEGCDSLNVANTLAVTLYEAVREK